ncbi:MAG: hypothetical protein WC670_10785 [Pseudolabrys sp.]|jgi:hypothetical protein
MARNPGKSRLSMAAMALILPLALQMPLSGCALGGGIGEKLPEALGGLPEGAPAQPTTPYQYPAVHDMPPARPTTPLDDAGQLQLQKELQGLRDQRESIAADPDAPPAKPPVPVKKKPAGAKSGQASGAKTNP